MKNIIVLNVYYGVYGYINKKVINEIIDKL